MSYQDLDEIRRLFEEIYPSNIRNRDVQGYADMYTENAVWIPPGDTTRYSPGDTRRVDSSPGFAESLKKRN